jgi:hypothetical protein
MVLGDAGEWSGKDLDAGLLSNLTPKSFEDELVEFQHAAGNLPCAVVAALDDEDPALVDDHAGKLTE